MMWRPIADLPKITFTLQSVVVLYDDDCTVMIWTHLDSEGWVYAEDGQPVSMADAARLWAPMPDDFQPYFMQLTGD